METMNRIHVIYLSIFASDDAIIVFLCEILSWNIYVEAEQ